MTNAGRVGVGIVLVLGLGVAAWLLLGRDEVIELTLDFR